MTAFHHKIMYSTVTLANAICKTSHTLSNVKLSHSYNHHTVIKGIIGTFTLT